MPKTSVIWRIARAGKAIFVNDEKADTSERIQFSQKQVVKRDNKKKRGVKEAGYEFMINETGMTKDELRAKADHFESMGIIVMSHYKFVSYGLFRMDDEQARETMIRIRDMAKMTEDLRWDMRSIDLGKMSYSDIEDKVEEFKAIQEELLTPEAKKELAYKVGYLHPEEMDDEQISKIAADMEFTKFVLRYNNNAYVQFHFHEKSIPERREFINARERLMLMPVINTEESKAILDDKLLTYENLSEFYGRDFISIGSEKDYLRFKKFFENNDAGVIKPRFDSLGKGIKVVRPADYKNLRSMFFELIDEYRRFLMEGLITQAPEMMALNPDSVNTVRVIAFYDGKETTIRSISMRIGHAGSFVDNAGAGGLTVAIDRETGKIDSNGCDENGFIYEKHPDSGVTLKGYQIPAWDKLFDVVNAVSGRIEGARYVGWDFACTDKYEWVLVEGNGKTGFFGAQAPHDRGRRKEFLTTIGVDPRGVLCDEVALQMAENIQETEEIPVEETMKKLVHFESLGLDGRLFMPNRAWELTDEECLALKEKDGDK